MHSLSAACRSHIDSRFSRGIIGTIAALSMCGCLTAPAPAQDAASKTNPPARAEFREPVTLASKDGVLKVRLTARQGTARLDTVATPVENFLVFDYQLIRGTPSDGQMSGSNLYPAPTLQVFPGETLIVHLENGLSGLTIRDYFSPQYTPKGGTVPIYPEQLTSSPLNLHIHGVHVSPKGNADNVLLHIPAGMSNTYTYNIPNNMPQGAYWYHSHLHGLTAAQTCTWALPVCSRSAAPTAICRSLRRTAFRSATCYCNITSSPIARTVSRSSTTRTGRNS